MDSYGLIEPVGIALTNEEIIILTENFAKDYMKKYDDSHSFDHAMRVKNIATILASSVNLNEEQIFIIQLAALTQEDILRIFFNNLIKDKQELEKIIYIACNVSLSVELANNNDMCFIELDCVRDADRIDSLGSMGISRYFTYGIIKNHSNIKSIIENIENRTNILMNNMKTDMGKKISKDKYKIIKMFIEDYHNTMFYQ